VLACSLLQCGIEVVGVLLFGGGGGTRALLEILRTETDLHYVFVICHIRCLKFAGDGFVCADIVD
jgi:hypothetical protein